MELETNFAPEISSHIGFRRVANRMMTDLGAPPGYAPAFESATLRLYVIITGQIEQDWKKWLHLSVSKWNKKKYALPSYSDMCRVKQIFLGDSAIAYSVFAPKTEHVNIHPTCLHLWAPLDHRPTPDFTWGTGSI